MWWPALWDVVVVLAFVVIGRETHEESNAIAAVVRTATPFLVGLSAGWATRMVRRAPRSVAAGLMVLASSLLVGMTMRKVVFDDGTAASFVVVATLFLGLGMVGRRGISRRWSAILARHRADSL